MNDPMKPLMLIVDDDPISIATLTNIFISSFNIVSEASGDGAIWQAINCNPDVLIMDIVMPQWSGIEVCRIIKANQSFKYLPILLISSDDSTQQKVAGYEAGAVDYITKPIIHHEVVARVGTHLNLSRLTRHLDQQVKLKTIELEDQIFQKNRIHEELRELNRSLAEIVNQKTSDLRRACDVANKANSYKSEFLAMMSHELRTPLNVILGFSEIIRDTARDGLDHEKVYEYSSDIHEAGTHLLDVINDILDISKIEAGKMSITPTLLEVPNVLASVNRLMAVRILKSGISIGIHIGEDARMVYADERAFKQIIYNLLSNSIKYTLAGGEIKIKTIRVDDNWVSIEVEDSGCGIPDDQISRLTLPFETINNSYATTETSIGLGIPLVNGLVRLHGGTFQIESCVGIGTKVTFTLPSSISVTGRTGNTNFQ